MDDKKNCCNENNAIDELSFTNAASGTDCTGAVPAGQDMSMEQYDNYNDVINFGPPTIKDRPVPDIKLEDKSNQNPGK
jgi:hypothetical protein